MSADLFFILVFAASSLAVLVLLFLSRVELAKNVKSLLAFHFLVADKFTVIQWYVRQDITDFFLTIIDVHIVCAHFVFLLLVADDPVATGCKESHTLGDLGKDLRIYHHHPLSNRFFAFNFRLQWCLWCLDSCWWCFITKYVLITLWVLLAFLFLLLQIIHLVIKHTIVFC